jgi:hypothetical protein
MTRTLGAVALVTMLAAVSAGALAATGGGGASRIGPPAAREAQPIEFEQHDLFICSSNTTRATGTPVCR